MKKKTKLIFILLLISLIFCKISYVYNINEKINNIKKHYQLDHYENCKFEFNKINLNYLLNKRNKDTEEYFILGYYYKENGDIYDAQRYFDLATEKISRSQNIFIKYYLYNRLSHKFINSDYEKSKKYTKMALQNIDLKTDNKAYLLVCDSLVKHRTKINGSKFVIENMEKCIERSNKENTFQLTKKIAPIYYLVGERDRAIKCFLAVLHTADEKKDTYSSAKSLIDLSLMFIDMRAYDLSEQLVYKALKEAKDINDERKYNMQLYAYIALCEINLNNEDFESLKENISQVYKLKGKVEPQYYNDFLMNAKVFESMVFVKQGQHQKAKECIDEASNILRNEEDILLADGDILVLIGYANYKYSIGENYEAIKFYKISYAKMLERKSIAYEVLILKELKEIYNDVGDEKSSNNVNQELKRISSQYQNEIANSYIKNSISEYKNLKKLQENFKYKIKIMIVIILMFIVFIVIILIYNVKTKKLEEELKIDQLTKVYNRGYFNFRYDTLLKNKSDFYIVMFDIDDFKKLNDTYGHEFGDEVLIGICRFFRKNISNNCSIYRYGGEEFVIIVKNKSKKEILYKAERCRQTIESMTWSKDVTVTVSIGIASSIENKDNTLNKADENLYISKFKGKNRLTM